MPNIVCNELTFESASDIVPYLTDGKFDFNKVIPMPEELNITCGGINKMGVYCYWKETMDNIRNGIDTTQNAKLLAEIEEFILSEFTFYKTIESFTSALEGNVYYGKPDESVLENGKQFMNNKKKYGATTWYEWCCSNWDTKWNAFDCSVEDNIVYFNTAWSPPINVVKQLSKMLQGKKLEIVYYGEIAVNGRLTFMNGEIVEEEYWDNREDDGDDEDYENL